MRLIDQRVEELVKHRVLEMQEMEKALVMELVSAYHLRECHSMQHPSSTNLILNYLQFAQMRVRVVPQLSSR